MATILQQNIDMTETADVVIRPPVFSEKKGYDWQHGDVIDAVFDGAHIPASSEEAGELLQERFGCAYAALPDEYKRDARLALIATVQSAGHQLKHAPEDMREQLDAAFFLEAMRLGARGWIIQWANEAVRADYRIALEAVRNDGTAIRYLSPAMQARADVQRAAIENTRSAIDLIEQPAQGIGEMIARIREQADRHMK